MDDISDYSLAELLCFTKNSNLQIQFLALDLIRLRFGEEGIKMFLSIQKYEVTTPQDAIKLLLELRSKDITEKRYQKRYTAEEIKGIVLESREDFPEDIKILFKIPAYLGV